MGPPLGFGKEIPPDLLEGVDSGMLSESDARKIYEDRHIQSLNLSLHHNDTLYAYVDVLDALSLQYMIIEQAQKINQQHQIPQEEEEEEEEEKTPSSQQDKDDGSSTQQHHLQHHHEKHKAPNRKQSQIIALGEINSGPKPQGETAPPNILGKMKTQIIKVVQDQRALEELQKELIGEIKMLAEDQRASKIHAVKELQKIKVEKMKQSSGDNSILAAISQTVKIQIQDQIAGNAHPTNNKPPTFGGFASILGAAISKASAPQPESHPISNNPPNLKQGSFALRGLGITNTINPPNAAHLIGLPPIATGERKVSAQINLQQQQMREHPTVAKMESIPENLDGNKGAQVNDEPPQIDHHTEEIKEML